MTVGTLLDSDSLSSSDLCITVLYITTPIFQSTLVLDAGNPRLLFQWLVHVPKHPKNVLFKNNLFFKIKKLKIKKPLIDSLNLFLPLLLTQRIEFVSQEEVFFKDLILKKKSIQK